MKTILGYVLVVILIIVWIFTYIEYLSEKKESRSWKEKYEACTHAIKHVDTVWIVKEGSLPVQHPKPITTKPKIVKKDSQVIVADKPLPKDNYDSICENIYIDSVSNKDVTISYELSVDGTLNYIQHNYKVKHPCVNTNHIIYEPKEVIKEILKSHLYLYGALGYAPFDNKFSCYEGGVEWVYKTNWGIRVGYEYANAHYLKAGISLKLK